jgi:excisionase family DNA binding protein
MTLDELGDQLFADVPQAASILGRDARTVRRAAAAREIPASKVGTKWMIPTAWLRQQAGIPTAAAAVPAPDIDELADRVAERLFARFASLFAVLADREAA